MSYTVTLESLDYYTSAPVSGVTYTVKNYNDPSIVYPVDANNQVEVPGGEIISIKAAATGYYDFDASQFFNEDKTFTMKMQRTDLQKEYQVYYVKGINSPRTVSSGDHVISVYKKVNGAWSLVESNHSTMYMIPLYTVPENGAEYKLVYQSQDYATIEHEFTVTNGQWPTYINYTAANRIITFSNSYIMYHVNVTDKETGDPISDASITVMSATIPQVQVGYNTYIEGYVIETSYDGTGSLTVAADGYTTYTDEIPLSLRGQEVTVNVELERPPMETTLTVGATDKRHGTEIADATVTVTNETTGDVITPVSGIYTIIYNYNYTYSVVITKSGYNTYSEEITPMSETPIALNVELEKILETAKLYITAENSKGETLDAEIKVYDEFTESYVEKTGDYWEVIYNDNEPYRIQAACDGYYDYIGDTFQPDSSQDIHTTVLMTKIPVYADLTVNVVDEETEEPIENATVKVLNETLHEYIEPTGLIYKLPAGEDYVFRVDAEADDYYSYTGLPFTVNNTDPITEIVELEKIPYYTPLTVIVQDEETGEDIENATVTVRNESTQETVEKSTDGKYYLLIDGSYYKVYARAEGYTSAETESFEATSTAPTSKILQLKSRVSPFATLQDLEHRTGIAYTAAEKERIEYLLEDISNLIRSEGRKCDIDVDAQVKSDRVYASIVRTVTCDVVQRVLRQSLDGDPMSQESQSGLGYSWSGTFAIPGGGIAMALMRNEKDILGFNPQTIGVIDLA